MNGTDPVKTTELPQSRSPGIQRASGIISNPVRSWAIDSRIHENCKTMSFPQFDPVSIAPLRHGSLGYRHRTPASDAHWVRMMATLLVVVTLIVTLVLSLAR